MKLIVVKLEPVDRQGHWLKETNEILSNALAVVIYDTPAFNQSEGQKVIHIFAIVKE